MVSPDNVFRIGMLVTLRETIAPDLWRIMDLEGKIAHLRPISLGATERQSPLTDLRRYILKTTDQVFHDEDLVRVRSLANPRSDDLYEYEVQREDGTDDRLRELELTVHVGSEAPDPVAQAQNLDAAPADLACARAALLHSYFAATARSLGIVGYNGARMLPIPHQISAARYALLFGRPRFLLADEVGLGKTVEAGLIVSTLRKYFPAWRVGFFVPESITVQWAFEMYGKFGKSIYRLDEDAELEEGDDDPGVILPHSAAPRWARSRANRPEILVVDEAHQALRDPEAYDALMTLSRSAHAVLLLTATPTSDDGENLRRLLQLADPEAFRHLDGASELADLFDKQGQVEKLLDALRDERIGGAELRALWEAVEIEDDELSARFMALLVDSSDLLMRHKLAALVTDRHYPGARILRYQRKFLAMDNEMAERVEDTVDYRPAREEVAVRARLEDWMALVRSAGVADEPAWQNAASVLIQAAHSSPLAVASWLCARRGRLERHPGVSADPVYRYLDTLSSLPLLGGEEEFLDKAAVDVRRWVRSSQSADMKGRDLAQLPRYQALLGRLRESLEHDPQGRFIVFTSFECNVKPLYLLLNRALGEDVSVFSISAEMEWREREKNAFAFQECNHACVLISDDLGGEGRNFQFADGLFHFDLPLGAWVIEQRIGRLDRVGRDPELDVDSQVLVAPGCLDETIYEFLRDGVNVFNESIAPVEDMIDVVSRRMITALLEEGDGAIGRLVEQTGEQLEARREREMLGLMTRADRGVEDVKRLVPQLQDADELADLSRAVKVYTRLLGSVVDDSRGRMTITVGSHHPLHASTGVLSEMQGFFNRAQAVRHERLEFFSPGHPFVRALARGALQESGDRVAFLARPGLERGAFLFSWRLFLPQTFLEAVRALPEDVQPSIFCSAAYHFGTRMVRIAIGFDGEPVDLDAPENETLARRYDHSSDVSLHLGREVFEMLPEGWDDLCVRAAARSGELAAASAADILAASIDDFDALVSEVLTRQFGSEFPIETQIETLLFELDPLSADLDSLVVLFPGEPAAPAENAP